METQYHVKGQDGRCVFIRNHTTGRTRARWAGQKQHEMMTIHDRAALGRVLRSFKRLGFRVTRTLTDRPERRGA